MLDRELIKQYLIEKKYWNCKNDSQIKSIIKIDNTIYLDIYLFPTSSYSVSKKINLNDYELWLRIKKIKILIK